MHSPPARTYYPRTTSTMLGLGNLPDHEADVRVARERRRLEDALHDERRARPDRSAGRRRPGNSLPGCSCFQSSRLLLRMLKSSSMRCRRLLSSIARVLPAAVPSTRIWLPVIGDHRRVDHVERVLGLRQLDVLVDRQSRRTRRRSSSRKTTVTTRKSIMLVSESDALTRCGCRRRRPSSGRT